MAQQGPIPRHPLPDKAIEKEFIYNLQYYVYFLELQGRLLREKMTEEKHYKSRGVEANPAFDAQLDENLPLTYLFERLREYFYQQARLHTGQLAERQEKIDALRQQIAHLEYIEREFAVYKENDQKRLQGEKANIEQLLKQYSDRLAETISYLDSSKMQNEISADYKYRVDKINQENLKKLTQNAADIKRMSYELQTLKQNTNEELEQLIAKQYLRIDELQTLLQAAYKEILDIKQQTQYIVADNSGLRQSNDLNAVEIRTLQSYVQNLKKELYDTSKYLSAQRSQNDELEREKVLLNNKLQILMRFDANYKQMLELYYNKRQIDQLNTTIAQLRDEVQTHVDAYKQSRLKEMQNDYYLTKQTEEISQLNKKLNEQNETVIAATSDNQQMAIKLQALEANTEAKDYQIEELNATMTEQAAKIQFLSSELQVRTELGYLQLEEFENCRKASNSLQERFNSISTKLDILEVSEKEYSRFGGAKKEKVQARPKKEDCGK